MERLTGSAKRFLLGPVLAVVMAAGSVQPVANVTGAIAAMVATTGLFVTVAEARPRGRGAHGRPHHRHRHAAPAPRRRHHYERRDDWRDDRRRAIRRRHALGFLYVSSLPQGCTTTIIYNGVRHYRCDGIYYRPYIDGGTTIYVISD